MSGHPSVTKPALVFKAPPRSQAQSRPASNPVPHSSASIYRRGWKGGIFGKMFKKLFGDQSAGEQAAHDATAQRKRNLSHKAPWINAMRRDV